MTRSINMQTKSDYRYRAAANRFTELRMNSYEQALAERQMEQAMALADLTLRALRRIRVLVSTVSTVLIGVIAQKRDYVKDGVVHCD
jgi:hypothetical protein